MTDLDELMNKDPLELSEQDIDAIIAYQRKMRAQRESGVKVKKGDSSKPAVKLDLAALGLLKPKAQAPTMKRRF
jgi:hypothetical protein